MTSRSHPIRGLAQRRGRKPGIDWEAERKEFESWYRFNWGSNPVSLDRFGLDGSYAEYGAKIAWAAWQKARNSIPKVSFK